MLDTVEKIIIPLLSVFGEEIPGLPPHSTSWGHGVRHSHRGAGGTQGSDGLSGVNLEGDVGECTAR